MLDFAKNYVYNHRRGLPTAAGFVGGLYLTKTYITERLEEVRHKIEQEGSSRDWYVSFGYYM
jgi:peroxin-3